MKNDIKRFLIFFHACFVFFFSPFLFFSFVACLETFSSGSSVNEDSSGFIRVSDYWTEITEIILQVRQMREQFSFENR
jgi:hypothetical protein